MNTIIKSALTHVESDQIPQAKQKMIELWNAIKKNPLDLNRIDNPADFASVIATMLQLKVIEDDDIIEKIASVGYVIISKDIEISPAPNKSMFRLLIISFAREQLNYALRDALDFNEGGSFSRNRMQMAEIRTENAMSKMEVYDLFTNPILHQRIPMFAEAKKELDDLILNNHFYNKNEAQVIQEGKDFHKKALDYLTEKILNLGDVEDEERDEDEQENSSVGESENIIIKVLNKKIEEIKTIIKNDISPKIKSLNGFSIFRFEDGLLDKKFDIYIPTNTIDKFYFFRYINGNFFDINSNQIQLSEIENCKYSTAEIIKNNYLRVLQYVHVHIDEHDMLNSGEYLSPRETGSDKFLNMGSHAFENKDFEAAYDYYTQAINLAPYDARLYLRRASCSVASKQYENAIEDICRTGLSNPTSKQNIFTFTYEELGNVYQMAGGCSQATIYYSLAFDNTKHWWLLKKIALCHSQLGNYQIAIKRFEEISNLVETNSLDEYEIQFAETCIKGGFINKAKTILNKIINFSGSYDNVFKAELAESINQPIKEKAKILLRDISD